MPYGVLTISALSTVPAIAAWHHPRPERDPERSPSTSSAWRRRSSARIRGPCGSTRTRACSARPGRRSNIRLYSENDIRRITWIRHLTRERGVNLAGIRILFELEERLGARILEALYAEGTDAERRQTDATSRNPTRRHRST